MKKISKLRLDRGDEYEFNHFNKFYEIKGIIQEVARFYSFESNGAAEGKNQILKRHEELMLS